MAEVTSKARTAPISVARIVHYTLSERDCLEIERQRLALWGAVGAVRNASGVRIGEVYPAVVVRKHTEDTVNLQVLLDGPDTYWATSRTEADPGGEGHWSWPPRV